MISFELSEEIAEQINRELESEYAYMCMANWLEKNDWFGFAKFMKQQAQEEREHAMKFYDFLHEAGFDFQLEDIEAISDQEFDNVLEVFKTALQQEMSMSDSIHDLYEIAENNNDRQAYSLLNWFEEEQLEEEELMETAKNLIIRAKDSTSAMMDLDEKFGKRDSNEFEF